MTEPTRYVAALALTVPLLGCPPEPQPEPDPDPETELPGSYTFDSRFDDGSGVSYSGQTFRHVLIDDMKSHVGGLTDRLDAGWFPQDGEVVAELDFYFQFDGATSGSLEHGADTTPAPLQVTYDDIASGKDLVGKVAGNDETGQHADWSTDFVGWDADGVTSPESLVRLWFEQIEDQSIAWSAGDYPLGPDGQPVADVYVTADGQDLRQLLQKFLVMSIAFSQGADDYMDDDLASKGLLSQNSVPDQDGKPYTTLEHAWDEGFGYFGASRTYIDWTDDEVADLGHLDADGDAAIDLLSEVCWGASVNAAKRDRGGVVASSFRQDAWEGFLAGRHLIAGADDLDADQLAELQGHRDQAIGAWEAAIAATVVHYINDVLGDMGAFDTADYSFEDHAKHWSEMKGFALGLQFNPRSPLSDAQFAELHSYLGTAPALPGDADAADYAQGLLDARALLGSAYGFDAANLGDDGGAGGW